MTKVLSLWLAVAALLAASCTEPSKPEPQLDSRYTITVDGSTVRYNGKELRWNVPADKWQNVLGPRSRRVRDIFVWDDIGVFLYLSDPPNNKKPDSFVVQLGRKPHSNITETEPDFWPKQTFRGRLVVDGALIHKDSTIQEIIRDKKGVAFRRGYLPSIYSYDLDSFYVRLDFGYDRSLTAFSFSRHISQEPPKSTQEPSEK